MVAWRGGAVGDVDITVPGQGQRTVPLDDPHVLAARSCYTTFGDEVPRKLREDARGRVVPGDCSAELRGPPPWCIFGRRSLAVWTSVRGLCACGLSACGLSALGLSALGLSALGL